MGRTTTREIIRVCADIARLDLRAKQEVLSYLQDELRAAASKIPPTPVVYAKEVEQ